MMDIDSIPFHPISATFVNELVTLMCRASELTDHEVARVATMRFDDHVDSGVMDRVTFVNTECERILREGISRDEARNILSKRLSMSKDERVVALSVGLSVS